MRYTGTPPHETVNFVFRLTSMNVSGKKSLKTFLTGTYFIDLHIIKDAS